MVEILHSETFEMSIDTVTDIKPADDTVNFQTMLQYIEPLSPEVCNNLLQREQNCATRNISKLGSGELMNLIESKSQESSL